MNLTADCSLVLRADATSRVGAGHAMRLSALAEAWIAGGYGEVVLWGDVAIDFVRDRYRSLGVTVRVSRPASLTESVLVVDHYGCAVREYGGRCQAMTRVLVDDEGGAIPNGYDIIWNPNAWSDRGLYPGFEGAVLCGGDYVPLRSDLTKWGGPSGRGTLVTLGGGTVPVELRQALEAVGRQRGDLCGVGEWTPESWTRIAAPDLWRAAAACDRMICAAGVTAWEAAAVGIPVVLVALAANQRPTARWAARAGVPTLDLRETLDTGRLVQALEQAIPRAKPLPPLENGAAAVVRSLRHPALLETGR